MCNFYFKDILIYYELFPASKSGTIKHLSSTMPFEYTENIWGNEKIYVKFRPDAIVK